MTDSTRTTRRRVLTAMPAITMAVALAMPASGEVLQSDKPTESPELQALIEAHREAYRSFMELLHRSGGKSRPASAADRIENEALLAVCAFRAQSEADRQTKAQYLLEVEERGELDLPEHMQAVLRSMV
ncbi:hypothetical protein SAZ10_00890 [Mesorhizobium sp. BAC0120]|uniref:hypothetical protein n=1 Tax=Mesorhizobium sp. BAC0120 TaxID=3090670 RepID=UPI00298CECE4|nr:hypothetical protein [Mesorhizobium sp. BAC0120]MDW6020312.1 hypothetical protein [Mesorhizobium sp. BAC0120]